MLGALLGLRARQAPRYGWLGGVGFALAFLGSALLTPSHSFQMQRISELRFSATLGQEPEIEVALV